jgi:predicted amidohydrolase YtcJ
MIPSVRATRPRFQVCVHANGDRAIEMTLDGFESIEGPSPQRSPAPAGSTVRW